MDFDFIKPLVKPAKTKILLLVMDGLGGLPAEKDGETELEAANTPNLDQLTEQGICGLHEPIGPGITPGSGPSHLALFGYDPQKYQIGRGVLAASGIDFELNSGDVAARGNFCTVDKGGVVTDRRAGRISTEKNAELCVLLEKISVPGIEIFIKPVKEHRFLLVIRGADLSEHVLDTDPQAVGEKPLEAKPSSADGERTAALLNTFIEKAATVLKDQHLANMVLLRGFSMLPGWPKFHEVFGLKSAAIAAYPMYLGLAKLVGMKTYPSENKIDDELEILKKHWADFDFFYVHIKSIDSAGEDGDYFRRIRLIEEVDSRIPLIRQLDPDVVIVTGDHSTPAILKAHSWHPVPVILWSKYCRPDSVDRFAERACVSGSLGPHFPAVDLMPLALANALRLDKFGA